MPWLTDAFQERVRQHEQLIEREFETSITARSFLCSREEMRDRFCTEVELRGIEENWDEITIRIWKERIAIHVDGKFFSETNEIWVVDGQPEMEGTILHELLHSVQVCEPHREGIVAYLTYKLLGNLNLINPLLRQDWEEIERQNGLDRIKNRLLQQGDCEDF